MSKTAGWPWTEGPVRLDVLEGGAVWHARLNSPKANILDIEKATLLTDLFRRARDEQGLKAIVIEGEGPNFSYGASVPEHLPGKYEAMLRSMHGLFLGMLDASVVTLAVVRGQCLGGGLELASFCHRLFASPDAKLGQPEIVLGVFAPVASVSLPDRIGRSRAEDLCLTGRSVGAEEGMRIGLVDQIADDPTAAAIGYVREFFLPRSASSLRLAVKAARAGFADRFRREIAEAERLYFEDLMATADAAEGLTAFVDKRAPVWRDQ